MAVEFERRAESAPRRAPSDEPDEPADQRGKAAETDGAPGEARVLPRWSLAATCAPLAAIFAWAAWVLPWEGGSLFAVVHGALALLHLATGTAAAFRLRALAAIWRLQAVLGLAYLAYVGWGLLGSAWYVRSLYAGLGDGVAAALVAVFGLVALLVLPLAIWGLAATGGVRLGRWGAVALGGVVALAGLRLVMMDARGVALASEAQIATFAAELAQIETATLPAPSRPVGLGQAAPAQCPAPPAPGTLTAIVAFAGERAEMRCLQATEPVALAAAIATMLKAEARHGFVKIDLLTARLPLGATLPFVESLAFRPGLDGACHQSQCLAPWQLVVLEAFTRHAPLPSVPDARLGAALDTIAARLGGPFERIATRGFLLSPTGIVELGRSPGPASMEVTTETLARAKAGAWRYVKRSQGGDGRFRYLVNPFNGRVISDDRSIARQAGTTLAVCELAPDDRTATRVAERSLDHLAALERRFAIGDEEAAVLRDDPKSTAARERIGPSALSLAAFLRCRPRVGDRHDALIARLSRALLAMQRPDGSFRHHLDLDRGEPLDDRGSIFVDGQIVLALTLLEERDPSLHAPVEAAMAHFGGPYWSGFLRPLLFLEENWHCIAAAAALPIHRHDGYERFCLDYVEMKGRIVHEEDDDVHPDFLGGYGFGNLVPPHNTATAGYGEALAAALLVMKARGLETTREEARMKLVLGFLLRNQHLAEHCFACAPGIAGSFSEHMASPLVRIDYVQHAWAALGHGARALALE
jgi:hypothetical protein